jgi:hypothetical protein
MFLCNELTAVSRPARIAFAALVGFIGRMSMKLSRSRIVLCALATIGLFAAWPLLAADGPKPPPQPPPPIQEGFTADYVLIERQDGSLTILEKPRARTLGNTTYLVGKTVFLDGVSTDRLFSLTVQWVRLSDVRRLGEFVGDDLSQIRTLALETKEKLKIGPEKIPLR